MKKNKKGMDYTCNNIENGTNCNCHSVDGCMDSGLNRIANIEAGTDILVRNNALTQEAAVNSGLGAVAGVTDDAMYHDLADYTMIPVDEDGENEKNIQNYQSS